MSTAYEKFLAGEPVNEENAKLRRGEMPDALSMLPPGFAEMLAGTPRAPLADAERGLKADERAALREMRQGPGWPVLQRLLERAIITNTNGAILLSQDNPIENKDAIAQAWLTVKTWKKLVSELNGTVEMELKLQEMEAHHETEPAQQGA